MTTPIPDLATLLNVALFSDEPPPGYVRREGLIFEVGDYPRQKFSLSEGEADVAVAAFTPVAGDVEHMPTVLSGHLGIMRRIWRDGKAVFGTADVPEWLDNVLKGTQSSISCAWDRNTKHLKGWGWVLDPAVTGAALMGKYAEFMATQETPTTEPVPPTSATSNVRQQKARRFMPLIDQLRNRMQATFSASGAGETAPTPPQTLPPITPTPAPAPPTPAPTPSPTPAPAPGVPPAAPGSPQTPGTGGSGSPAPVAQFAAPGANVEPMDEATASFRADQIISRATEVADALIAQGHLHSVGRNAAIAAFAMVGFDNEQSGPSLVTFSTADNRVLQDRVEILRQAFLAAPKHSLFAAQLPANLLNGNKGATETKSAEQSGREQAARFNETMAGLVAAPGLQALNLTGQSGQVNVVGLPHQNGH